MSVLDVRLANIEHHLKEAQDAETWLSKLATEDKMAKNLWEYAFDKIRDEAGDLEAEISDLRDSVEAGKSTEADAWRDYHTIRARTESVLRECLDLVGGLALRDRSTDDSICQLADELISECAQPTLRVLGTVPTLSGDADDSLRSTLRRVASVRFPDWSLWTVPMVAQEYALVMTEVEDRLRSYVATQAKSWVDAHQQASEEEREHAEMKAAGWARVLLADAFATFIMGPAFACSSLLLRLDPSEPPRAYRPSDEVRARMILGVLEVMDEAAFDAYGDLRSYLGEQWDEISRQSDADDLMQLAGVLSHAPVASYFQRKFRWGRTGYSPAGWEQARQWSREWQIALRNKEHLLHVPAVTPTSSLRDALNAVWDCRIWINRQDIGNDERDVWVKKVEVAGRQLCDRLVGEPPPPAGPSVPQARRGPGS